MLKSLTVENYALIERLEMDLDPSLNIITGETGAGKSILLGALGLLLGGKNDGTATRDNTKSCVVEALFSLEGLDLEPLFEEMEWEWEEQTTIRRVITASGKSRSFVGDIPVSLSDIKMLGSRLIDIHSQHQNQILGNEDFRIKALDSLYDSASLLSEYRQNYNQLHSLHSQLRQCEEIASTARRDEEWLTHQVEELRLAKLEAGELARAEAELGILENAESIGLALRSVTDRLEGDDERAILSELVGAERELRSVEGSYPPAGEFSERLRSVVEELKDLASSVMESSERVESDPERLSVVSERIDRLYSLCQKHRAQSVEELIEIRDGYATQLSTIQNSDEQIESLRRQIAQREESLRKVATSITTSRMGVSPQFSQRITSLLHRLGMAQSRFEVEVTPRSELSPLGGDIVTFLFSSVEGRALQGVDRIASGGEVSRLMLSLKALLAERISLPTIIFDEIDTGVSGRIAEAMGEIISELSGSMQVIDITHLPQVASKGDSHFVVFKDGGHTNIRRLTTPQRVEHIAMMLSGSEVTPAARQQAEILLRVMPE